MEKVRNLTGKYLNELWNAGAKHALYREDGKWYHQLKEFPGALFDANGYVIFNTEQDYLQSPYLQIQQDLHISEGISAIPNYVRITEQNQLQSISHNIKKISEDKREYESGGKASSNNISKVPKGQNIVKRNLIQNERIIRDTKVSSWVKYIHGYKCQICGVVLEIGEGQPYAEAHHIKPLGNSHNGPDVVENILCVCPNHHALLDFFAVYIEKTKLRHADGYEINEEYIGYHNSFVDKKVWQY